MNCLRCSKPITDAEYTINNVAIGNCCREAYFEVPAFPLKNYIHQLPKHRSTHPGAFGAVRKFDVHTGVDLYCSPYTPVYAVEDGEVVEIEVFTGPNAESPWWHETMALLVEGKSGVICYGEVMIPWHPAQKTKKIKERGDIEIQDLTSLAHLGVHQRGTPLVKPGSQVKRGEIIALTKQVLKRDKGKPMCMLHFELYKHGTRETVWWKRDEPQPECLLDPTPLLTIALQSSS